MAPRAIIFDFDGVIADSETLSNTALANSLTAIGLPTSFEDSIAHYYGHSWQDMQRRIEERHGQALPADFRQNHHRQSRAIFEAQLAPVDGAPEFLAQSCHLPRGIASSSHPDYLAWSLNRFELAGHFGDHVYSADGMARGKPHPDIYLRAAAGLGVAPDDCWAIEDSPTGARAAVAAGMHVIGLCAASHIRDPQGHANQLRAVGVHAIAFRYADIMF